MEFNLVDLCLSVTTDNKAALVQRLFRSSSEFSSVCRDVVCRWPARDCSECRDYRECQWYQVFGQDLAVDPEALKRHQKPPLPFVFSFESCDVLSRKAGTAVVRLVVIGRAISCLDMLLAGFEALIKGYSDDFKSLPGQLVSRDYQGNPLILGEEGCIENQENLIVLAASGIIETRPWSCDRLGVIFSSPVRIISKGHILRDFDTALFARSLLRRVSSMAYYYGEASQADFKELSRQVDQIVCSEERFCFQPLWVETNKLSGIMGACMLSGCFYDLLPFIVLGSYLHIGKGASFGMGNYALYTDQ